MALPLTDALLESFSLSPLLEQARDATLGFIRGEVDQKDDFDDAKFADVPDYLTARFITPESQLKHKHDLQELERKCAIILGEVAAPIFQQSIPQQRAGTSVRLLRGVKPLKVRLHQMGFSENSAVKGSSNLVDVLKTLDANLVGKGCLTEKYPLEILYGLNNSRAQPGDEVEPFSIGVSIGFGVTLACHLACLAALHMPWLDPLPPGVQESQQEFQRDMAQRILAMLRLTATHTPAATLEEQVRETLSTKIQASARPRPTTLQMLYSFRRLVENRSLSSRLSKDALMRTCLVEYNKSQVAHVRINSDETTCIIFLMARTPLFIRRVKVMWGVEAPQYTALPLSLLGCAWLSPMYSLPFRSDENPLWANYMKATEAGYEAGLANVESM